MAIKKEDDQITNFVLELIATPSSSPIIIDNGKSEFWQTGRTAASEIEVAKTIPKDTVFAVFKNSTLAYDYFKSSKGAFSSIDLPNRIYPVKVIAGMSPEAKYVFNALKLIINVISMILGLVAIIVVFLQVFVWSIKIKKG